MGRLFYAIHKDVIGAVTVTVLLVTVKLVKVLI
jgi:hypothetical protein